VRRAGNLTTFITRIIKRFSSNTSCFIVCEATCFGPYVTIIRPSYESSQEKHVSAHTRKHDVFDENCFIILVLNFNTSGYRQSKTTQLSLNGLITINYN